MCIRDSSNLENSKAADRLPEAAACIAEVAQKLTKQKTPSQNTSLTVSYTHLYFTGSTRMYWMKNSEENYAAAVKSLLLARGFGVTTIHQVVIGSTTVCLLYTSRGV